MNLLQANQQYSFGGINEFLVILFFRLLFVGIHYLENLHVSTTLSSTDSTPSTDSTSSTHFLPRIIEFSDLDQTKELKAAKKALKGVAGVYAFINKITGLPFPVQLCCVHWKFNEYRKSTGRSSSNQEY